MTAIYVKDLKMTLTTGTHPHLRIRIVLLKEHYQLSTSEQAMVFYIKALRVTLTTAAHLLFHHQRESWAQRVTICTRQRWEPKKYSFLNANSNTLTLRYIIVNATYLAFYESSVEHYFVLVVNNLLLKHISSLLASSRMDSAALGLK